MLFIYISIILVITSNSLLLVSNTFEVFASSPSVVRQDIIDGKEDWILWNLNNDADKRTKVLNNNSLSKSQIQSNCNLSVPLAPDIESISYKSDGKRLNATLWLSKPFIELLMTESKTERVIKFTMTLDIKSIHDTGTDYRMEWASEPTSASSSPSSPQVWSHKIYEVSAFEKSRLISDKIYNEFPFNNKNFIDFSINLESIGYPQQFRILFYITDLYYENEKKCRIVDTSNWIIVPPPDYKILISSNNLIMRPSDKESILLRIIGDTDLQGEARLFTDINDNNNRTNDKNKYINYNFVLDKITVSPFTNGSSILNIEIPNNLTIKADILLSIQVYANISFPSSITNKGGEIFYNNDTTSQLEYSNLTLTIKPPLEVLEVIKNISGEFEPLVKTWWGIISMIVGIITGIVTLIVKKILPFYRKKQRYNYPY